jgi:hypothetical protein
MAWDDAKKEKAVKLYQDAEPTPETSVEIVKSVADELGETANGVRMILSKAGVYVKAAAAAPGAAKKPVAGGDKAPKVSKEDKIAALSAQISALGLIPDSSILDKLTGKAADYFVSVLSATKSDE